MEHITVIGEAVADAFLPAGRAADGALRMEVRPGGGPLNTAVGLGRLGTPAAFAGRLAAGPFGDLFRERLASSRVGLAPAVAAAEQATLAVTAVGPGGGAGYEFYAEGTADWQWTAAELDRIPAGARCLHTGSMALVREPGGPLIEELLARRRAGATISIDPNVRPLFAPAERYRDRLPVWTSLADVFRLSEEDLAVLAPGTTPEDACDAWHANGVRLVAVTLGARGALLSLGGDRVTVPAPEIEPVDTVGAGDAFTAGLLHRLDGQGRLGGRLDGLTLAEVTSAAEFAVRHAAATCLVPGADPPWGDQDPPSG
ncbi:carbohydrate kinase [Actinomadura sp. 21ATH]|uniref:carbohydrate kinase family protein n=1 Tax=Actinomadura sp. 21ATH TaxID=1735444 RepID=UPI0035C1AD5D